MIDSKFDSKFDGVIFDMDGTLADSLADIVDVMNNILEQQGFPTHTLQEYNYFVGGGIRELVTGCLPPEKRSQEIIDKSYNMMAKDYPKNCLNKTKLYDGIEEVINTLHANGKKLAIYSNKTHELTYQMAVDLLDIEKFNVVRGAKDGFPNKPNPAGANLICEEIGVPASRIAYIGDTDTDMQTAKNAGFFAIGAAWGFRTTKELIANGADAIADKPLDLLNIILNE